MELDQLILSSYVKNENTQEKPENIGENSAMQRRGKDPY